MGAWIETEGGRGRGTRLVVAPYVGAWIETINDTLTSVYQVSHPMWVRGLKRDVKAASVYCASRTLCGCVD